MSADFAGVQGTGSTPAYQGDHTWGGSGPRRIVTDHSLPDPAGMFRIRDGYDGEYLYVVAGEMVPLTESVRAEKDAALVCTRAELRELRGCIDALSDAVSEMLRR